MIFLPVSGLLPPRHVPLPGGRLPAGLEQADRRAERDAGGLSDTEGSARSAPKAGLRTGTGVVRRAGRTAGPADDLRSAVRSVPDGLLRRLQFAEGPRHGTQSCLAGPNLAPRVPHAGIDDAGRNRDESSDRCGLRPHHAGRDQLHHPSPALAPAGHARAVGQGLRRQRLPRRRHLDPRPVPGPAAQQTAHPGPRASGRRLVPAGDRHREGASRRCADHREVHRRHCLRRLLPTGHDAD